MAISFSKSISIIKILNAYNNNVVEFTSDNASPEKKCVINIGGQDITITPINGVFWYDFSEVVVTLINTNNFSDDIVPTNDIEVDNSLIKSWLVTFTITFEDDTTEQTTKTYVFLKSIEQIANVNNRLISEQQILTKKNLTFFKGYPFDIAHYSDGDITLTNTSNDITGILSSTATNTDRIFLSLGNTLYLSSDAVSNAFKTRVENDGGIYEVNTCWLSTLFSLLDVGINIVTIVGTTTETFIINLKDVDCGGTYLKWFNEKSGWHYWLFNPIEKSNLQTKTSGIFKNDFESIDNTFSKSLTVSRSATKFKNLIADSLTIDERLQLEDLLSSPRIEMYNGSYGDVVTNESWQTVLISDGTFNIENTKTVSGDLRITIEINKYTQR